MVMVVEANPLWLFIESLLGFQEKEMEVEDRSSDYRLVPWLSWDQWNFVSESLFSSSPDSITTALKRISVWRSRGCLPIVIEITASIVEIQQMDPFFREGPIKDALNSEEMLAMLYCMAITRLVNGVVEKTRKKTEVSIAEAADAIGLPRMLIDIRHEGSHRDLPSLRLVRLASVKALDWLKSYYWEPQKNAIPFQRDTVANVKKEIKSKLRELAFHLSIKQAQHSDSLPMKGRRVKQSELLCGRNKFFTHMAGKLQASKSGGSKKQITKTLGILVRLYSSFPSEVVAVLLEFLLKSDSSDGSEVDPYENSLVEPSHGNLKTLTVTTDIWKLVVSRFSSKEPELLLTMLKAVLETIETLEALRYEIGEVRLSPSEYKAKICQIEYLSAMVEWLIGNYKKVKHPPSRIGSGPEIQDSSVVTNVQKRTLTELLRTCLLVSSPGNNQLAQSALLLVQMIGNISMVGRLKKLSELRMPSLDFAEETASFESILLQHESSISQAAEKLEFLKRCRIKGKAVNTVVSNKEKQENTWTVAKSWNPCPIGMLPCTLGSTGILPILDRAMDMPEVQQFSESREPWELNRRSGKRQASCDAESLENSNIFKKTRETIEVDWADDRASLLEPFKGQLMIDGAWKKVGEEELLAIESAVRILV